jgi:hypothetical protein
MVAMSSSTLGARDEKLKDSQYFRAGGHLVEKEACECGTDDGLRPVARYNVAEMGRNRTLAAAA